jgi:hypothetical protein
MSLNFKRATLLILPLHTEMVRIILANSSVLPLKPCFIFTLCPFQISAEILFSPTYFVNSHSLFGIEGRTRQLLSLPFTIIIQFSKYCSKVYDLINSTTRQEFVYKIFTVTKERASRHIANKKSRNNPHSGRFIASSNIAMNLKNAKIAE